MEPSQSTSTEPRATETHPPEVKEPGKSSAAPQSLDLTGLPAPVVDELRRLVATLRDNLAQGSSPPISAGDSPDEWIRRLQAWVDTHPTRAVTIDDSREGLYADRGE